MLINTVASNSLQNINSNGTEINKSEVDKKSARKVAKEFEALFIGMTIKSMRETVGKDKVAGGGKGEEVYSSLLDQEYAKALAENGGVGLARMLESHMSMLGTENDNSRGVASYGKSLQSGKIEVGHENR